MKLPKINVLWLGWVFCLPMSCAQYYPKALDGKLIDKPLKTPRFSDLTLDVAKIQHPLVKPIAFDLSNGLSPDEAALLAIANNPECRAARDQHGIANAQLLQAGLLPNPRLTYNPIVPSGGLSQGKVAGFGLGLDWDVTALLTQSNKVVAAEAEQHAIDLKIAWQEWQIAQAAKLASYQLWVYGAQQRLLEDIVQRLESNRLQVQQAADRGLVTELDRVAAMTAKNTAESRLQAVIQQKKLQQQRLNRALGLKPQATLTLQNDIALATNFQPPSFNTLTEHLSQRRLDLMALQQGYAHQEEQLHAAILQQFPKISIGFTHSKNNSDYYTVGAGVAVSLPIFDQNQGAIALASATRQQLFDEYTNRVFQTRADIAELLATINNVNEQIQTVNSSLPDLQSVQQVYQNASALEQVDIISYYHAWNNVTDKKLELLNLQRQLMEARIALEIATGTYAL